MIWILQIIFWMILIWNQLEKNDFDFDFKSLFVYFNSQSQHNVYNSTRREQW